MLDSLSLTKATASPRPLPLDHWSFETWCERFESPAILDDGILLAESADGSWVGLSMPMASGLPGQLRTGRTGVLAPRRGFGVASVLEPAAVRFAMRPGARGIITRPHSTNRSMLAIDEQPGFVRGTAFITRQLELHPEGGT